MMKRALFFSFVFLLTASVLAAADTVTLKTGKVIECEVLELTPIFVRIREEGNEMTMREILIDQVEKIDREPVPEEDLAKDAKDKKIEYLRRQVEEAVNAPITGLHSETPAPQQEEPLAVEEPIPEEINVVEEMPAVAQSSVVAQPPAVAEPVTEIIAQPDIPPPPESPAPEPVPELVPGIVEEPAAPILTGPPEILTNEMIEEFAAPPEQIPSEPSTAVEPPPESVPPTAVDQAVGRESGFPLIWLVLLFVAVGGAAAYFLKRKGQAGIVSDQKETPGASVGGQPEPVRKVHPSISVTGRPLQPMKPLPGKESKPVMEVKGREELPKEPGKITVGQVKLNLKGWQAVVAAVVLMVVLSGRVATFKDKMGDIALMRDLKVHIKEDYCAEDVDRLKVAVESGDTKRIDTVSESVVSAEPKILSVQASYPILDFSSNKEVVIKVVYALNDSSGTRETRTRYFLYKHNFLANYWSYQYVTTSVSYYMNFM